MQAAYSQVLQSQDHFPEIPGTVIPLNRLETGNRELLAALLKAGGDRPLAQLEGSLAELMGRSGIFLVPSGRAAIAHILSALPHEEVVIPAYTSPDVRGAAKVAGKKAIYVDVAPGSVNATAAQFEEHAKPGRVLVPTHLFGVPTDIEAICRLGKDRGCVTIEDAAGAFLGRQNGRMLGTFSDFGVLSFERGKHFAAFRGGAIVVNDDSLIDDAVLGDYRLTRTRDGLPLREIAHAMFYNVATVPWLYGRFSVPWILRQISKSGEAPPRSSATGEQPGVVDGLLADSFYCRSFHPYQAVLLNRLLARRDRIRDSIASLAKLYFDTFEGTRVRVLVPAERDDGGLLRFPIAVPDGTRTEFLRRALARGLYLEVNYGEVLAEPPSSHPQYPNSVWAAENVVVLPLYSRLSTIDARVIAEQVVEIVDELS